MSDYDAGPPPGYRWANTEAGQVLVKLKRGNPEGSLKARCYAAVKQWAAAHPETPLTLIKYSAGHFDSDQGKHYAIGTPGVGDFLIGICGKCIMCEAKSATGRQSDGQRRMQAMWEKTGNPYLLVREPAELTDALNSIVNQQRAK